MFYGDYISIVLCTYNGSAYIAEQLKSIKNQTVQPDEIIIVDDFSDDDTVKIIRHEMCDWKGKLQIFVNEKNIGFRKNFAYAMKKAHGDIIFLSDQDDWWEASKIETQVTALEENRKYMLCFHNALLVDKDLKSLRISFWDALHFNPESFLNGDYSIFSIDSIVQGCSCAFRKELFKMSEPFCEYANHDEWLAMNAVMHGGILPINECLLQYRQTNTNTLGAPNINEGIIGKAIRWRNNTKSLFYSHIKNIYRKNIVWDNFFYKYGNSIHFLHVSAEEYCKFLHKRKNSFMKNDCNKLPNMKWYMRVYRNKYYSMKIYIKDHLMFFYRNDYLGKFK